MAMPEYIERFKVLRELGKGSQGIVYLAADPRLERNVAIKTLHRQSVLNQDRQDRLLSEAKTVSKLQHPNIVPLYEAGQDHGLLYLVFEYVDGISLKEQMRSVGLYVVHRAIRLLIQILDGISCAHSEAIVHRDLSPSNILIDKNGLPRIMDFGISVVMGKTATGRDKEIAGTPLYMSPEHFSKQGVCAQSDIFSLGLIFYEMLTARPAIEADNDYTIMYKIANEKIEPPSKINSAVDKELDSIVMKALERSLDERYSSALEMKKDLTDYLEKRGDEDARNANRVSHSTLDFLLRKIRYKSDFPTFSNNIIEINRKASVSKVNKSSASELANVVLKDYSLTNKLLKLVNSSFYSQFAGKITTISRAVVVLGFEQVSMVASSLMLFDQLKNKNQKEVLRESAVTSFMSGMIARELAAGMRGEEAEEAFICSMFHNLGKHLVLFYFEEEYAQIISLVESKGINEESAARTVLGMSYEDMGTGIAAIWQFPAKIVNSMRGLPKGRLEPPKTEEDRLKALSCFSNELCAIINSHDDNAGNDLAGLLKRFEKVIPLTKKQLYTILESARETLDEFSAIYNIKLKKSSFIRQVDTFSKAGHLVEDKPKDNSAEKREVDELLQDSFNDVSIPCSLNDTGEIRDPQSILINGIQDITNTLLEEFRLDDVLTMILETMYRGFSFNRVLFCMYNPKDMEIRARLGLGKDITRVLKDFRFKVTRYPDFFNFAVMQAKDIGVHDAKDIRFQKRIPEWYSKNISAPAFVLYPIAVNKKVAGLFYADREVIGRVLTGNQVNYMKTLCNQAVLAMKQSG